MVPWSPGSPKVYLTLTAGKGEELLQRQAPAKLAWTQLELRVPQTQADGRRASTGDRHPRSFLGPQHPARIEVALNPS